MAQQFYKLTSDSGVFSEYIDKALVDKELQNLIDNGKGGTITTVWHYTSKELQTMADNVKAYNVRMNRPNLVSDYAYMVLELMETETHANNYCAALREVLDAFPAVNREELETELNRFI